LILSAEKRRIYRRPYTFGFCANRDGKHATEESMNGLDTISGIEFEGLIAQLLERMGFRAEITKWVAQVPYSGLAALRCLFKNSKGRNIKERMLRYVVLVAPRRESRKARMKGSRSPSRTRSASPTSNLVRTSLTSR
jgi:hypothetical protein